MMIIIIVILGYHPPFSTLLPYIAAATYTRAEEQLLIAIELERWRLEIALDHLTCYRNKGSQYYSWTISLFCIH